MQIPNAYKHFRLILSGLIFVFVVAVGGAVRAQTNAGAITNMTVSVDATNGDSYYVFWLNSGGLASVTAFADDVVRMRFSYNGFWAKEEPMIAASLEAWPAEANTITDQGTNYLLQTALLNVVINKNPFRVDFYDRLGGYALVQDDPTNAIQYNTSYQMPAWVTSGNNVPTGISKLKCTKLMPSNQAYFGFGEFAGPSNRRGLTMMCWNHQSYKWGDNQNPLYMNTPFFYGVQPAVGNTPAFAYGIFFDNPCRATFRMGSQSSYQYSFEAGDGQMDYYFFGGGTNHTTEAVINDYSYLTGRPTMLPKWAMGYQLGRHTYWDQNWVQYIASTATASIIPLEAIYLDIDYMNYGTDTTHMTTGPLKQTTVNTSYYPDPYGMITNCASYHVNVIPLIEPWLETSDPLYTGEATNLDFIKSNSGVEFVGGIFVGNVSWFDFTSTPTTNRWQADEVKWFNSVPWGGIWNDLTEPEDNDTIPINALTWLDGRYGNATGSGADTRRQWSNEKNYFVLASASSSYSVLRTVYPDRRPFVLTRSGNSGVQRYAAGWSGDTGATWYYNQACIRLGANTMISGQANFGHDLGGFAGSVTGELLTRCHEWGALLPLCINHSEKGDNVWPDGNQGREPWRFTPSQNYPAADGTNYYALMQKNIQFRYQLMPYLYTLMYDSTIDGKPMNTPVFFNHYADNNTLSQNEFDFLCGDYLLAAPIYTQGTTTRTVYLPSTCDWYYYPNNVRYSGGESVTVSAPLGTLPLFVRADAIIPMGPSMQYANQFTPDYLDLDCWPENSSSFTLYEDEGEGWNYTNGVYALTTFSGSRTSNTWDFAIGARQGSYNPGARAFHVYVNNPDPVQDVLLNGSPIGQVSGTNSAAPGWFVTGDGKLVILATDTGSNQTIHVDWSPASAYTTMTVAATFNNWNPALNNMQYAGDHFWLYDVTFTGQSNLQFKIAANGGWATSWGETNGAQQPLTAPVSGIAKLGGPTNIVLNGTYNGPYEFTFDDRTLQYSVRPLYDSPYGFMTLAGTFNGWNQTLENMQLAADDTWQCVVGFSNVTNIQFKFTANGTWATNWGETNHSQTSFTAPLSGSGKPNGSTNILINAVLNGEYQFTFNDQTRAYSVQAFTSDSVGDGIPDWWRALYFNGGTSNYFGNTTNSQSCAACDPDGDGMNNLQEYLSGTVPTNSASFLHVISVTPQGTNVVVTWYTAGGHTNVVQAAAGLPDGSYSNNFVDVSPNIIIPGSGDTTTNYPDWGGVTNSPSRYYRVRLQQ